MLAYVFWHRPRDGIDAGAYEAALVAFHEALGREALEGVHGSTAFAVEDLPWLGGPGYEDWYHLEASFALDTLNAAAVTGPMTEPHRAVASLTGAMVGGVYRQVEGVWRRQMVLGPIPELRGPESGAGRRPIFA